LRLTASRRVAVYVKLSDGYQIDDFEKSLKIIIRKSFLRGL
jgi:hypothetical protein